MSNIKSGSQSFTGTEVKKFGKTRRSSRRSKFPVNFFTVANPYNPYDQFRLGESIDYSVHPNSITPERWLKVTL